MTRVKNSSRTYGFITRLFSWLLTIIMCISMMQFTTSSVYAAEESQWETNISIEATEGQYEGGKEVLLKYRAKLKDGADNESAYQGTLGFYVPKDFFTDGSGGHPQIPVNFEGSAINDVKVFETEGFEYTSTVWLDESGNASQEGELGTQAYDRYSIKFNYNYYLAAAAGTETEILTDIEIKILQVISKEYNESEELQVFSETDDNEITVGVVEKPKEPEHIGDIEVEKSGYAVFRPTTGQDGETVYELYQKEENIKDVAPGDIILFKIEATNKSNYTIKELKFTDKLHQDVYKYLDDANGGDSLNFKVENSTYVGIDQLSTNFFDNKPHEWTYSDEIIEDRKIYTMNVEGPFPKGSVTEVGLFAEVIVTDMNIDRENLVTVEEVGEPSNSGDAVCLPPIVQKGFDIALTTNFSDFYKYNKETYSYTNMGYFSATSKSKKVPDETYVLRNYIHVSNQSTETIGRTDIVIYLAEGYKLLTDEKIVGENGGAKFKELLNSEGIPVTEQLTYDGKTTTLKAYHITTSELGGNSFSMTSNTNFGFYYYVGLNGKIGDPKPGGEYYTELDFYATAEVCDFYKETQEVLSDKDIPGYDIITDEKALELKIEKLKDIDSTPDTILGNDLWASDGTWKEKMNVINEDAKTNPDADEDDFDFDYVKFHNKPGTDDDLKNIISKKRYVLSNGNVPNISEISLIMGGGESVEEALKNSGYSVLDSSGITNTLKTCFVYEITINEDGLIDLYSDETKESTFTDTLPKGLKLFTYNKQGVDTPVYGVRVIKYIPLVYATNVDGKHVISYEDGDVLPIDMNLNGGKNGTDGWGGDKNYINGPITGYNEARVRYAYDSGIKVYVDEGQDKTQTLTMVFDKPNNEINYNDSFTSAAYKVYLLVTIDPKNQPVANTALKNVAKLEYKGIVHESEEKTFVTLDLNASTAFVRKFVKSGEGYVSKPNYGIININESTMEGSASYRIRIRKDNSSTMSTTVADTIDINYFKAFDDIVATSHKGTGFDSVTGELLNAELENPSTAETATTENKLTITALPSEKDFKMHYIDFNVLYQNLEYGKAIRNSASGSTVTSVVPGKLELIKKNASDEILTGYQFDLYYGDVKTEIDKGEITTSIVADKTNPVKDINGQNVKFVSNSETSVSSKPFFPDGYILGETKDIDLVLVETEAPNGYEESINSEYRVIARIDAQGNLTFGTVTSDGKFSALTAVEEGNGQQSITIHNGTSYVAPKPAEFSITAKKKLQEHDMTPGIKVTDFKISISGDYTETKYISTDSTVKFDFIYSQEGVYNYTISEYIPLKEEEGYNDKVEYDETIYTVQVTVAKSTQENALEVTEVIYEAGQILISKDDIEFTNKVGTKIPVKTEAVFNLEANKLFEEEPSEKQFDFVAELIEGDETLLTGLTSESKIEARNNESGKVIFGDIEVTGEGKFKFQVKEVIGTDSDIVYDESVYEATVTASTDENGELVTSVVYNTNAGQITFKNSEKPTNPPGGGDDDPKDAEVQLTAKKTLDNKEPGNIPFTFELKNENGEIIQSKQSSSSGNVSFDTLTFNSTGTFKYTIVEKIGVGGYEYDTAIYTATIEVTQTDSNSDYKATVSYEKDGNDYQGKPEFNNTTIVEGKLIDVSVTKVWDLPVGMEIPESVEVQLLRDGTSYGDKVLLNVANGWTYVWKNLDDKYDWTVEEINLSADYISTVTLDKTNNKLFNFTITNKLDTKTPIDESAKVNLSANKTYNGNAPTNETFRFILKDEDGKVVEIVTNTPSGKVSFSDLTFTSEGTYTYTIEESNNNAPSVVYDKSVYEAKIIITKTDDGKLTSKVTYYLLDDEGNHVTNSENPPTYHNTGDPSTPEKPGEPGEPGKPGKQGKPGKPGKPGNPSTPDNPNEFTEFDDNGAPSGTWSKDPETDEWIFIPMDQIPVSPYTGDGNLGTVIMLVSAMIIALGSILFLNKKKRFNV